MLHPRKVLGAKRNSAVPRAGPRDPASHLLLMLCTPREGRQLRASARQGPRAPRRVPQGDAARSSHRPLPARGRAGWHLPGLVTPCPAGHGLGLRLVPRSGWGAEQWGGKEPRSGGTARSGAVPALRQGERNKGQRGPEGWHLGDTTGTGPGHSARGDAGAEEGPGKGKRPWQPQGSWGGCEGSTAAAGVPLRCPRAVSGQEKTFSRDTAVPVQLPLQCLPGLLLPRLL